MFDPSFLWWGLVPVSMALPFAVLMPGCPRRDAVREARSVLSGRDDARLDEAFLRVLGFRGAHGESVDFEGARRALTSTFRYETSIDLATLPVGLRATMAVLALSASDHARDADLRQTTEPDAFTERRFAGMADSLLLDRKAMREIELATTGHAWWETVALTLKRRSDQAGGWVTPADLSGLLKDEPDLLAALSGPSGATVPRASAIVSHWMTETVARTPIPQPRTEEAARALDMFRHRLMECGA